MPSPQMHAWPTLLGGAEQVYINRLLVHSTAGPDIQRQLFFAYLFARGTATVISSWPRPRGGTTRSSASGCTYGRTGEPLDPPRAPGA